MTKVRSEKFPVDDTKRNELLSKVLIPIANKYVTDESRVLGYECNFKVDTFMSAWANGNLMFLTAWDGDKLVGSLFAYKTQPLFSSVPTLMIERWDSDTPEVEKALFDFALMSADIINASIVQVLDAPWRKNPLVEQCDPRFQVNVQTLKRE